MKYLPLLAILFLSCEKSVEPENPSATGQWSSPPGQYAFNLFLTQNGNTVSGNGQQSSNAVTVSGGVNYPDVVLNIVGPTVTHSFSGKFVDANNISGKVGNTDVALARQ